MDEDTEYWLRLAESDMVSAEALHRAGQEPHTLFFLQQAVEKTLKALVVKNIGTMPPRIHSLPALAEKCGLRLTPQQARLLERLDRSYTGSRYPEGWGDQAAQVSAQEAERLLSESKDFLVWLRQKL